MLTIQHVQAIPYITLKNLTKPQVYKIDTPPSLQGLLFYMTIL